MDTVTLLCIIGGGVLLLVIIAIIFIRRTNKKRFNKLQENLDKYKAENKEFEHNAKITLAKDENKGEQTQIEGNDQQPKIEEQKEEPLIEEYDEEPLPTNFGQSTRKNSSDSDFEKFLRENGIRPHRTNKCNNATQNDDDFEEFLDEHAYSRRILNKDIMNKLKDLPPEIKAVILSNVFNKYEDN